MVSLVSTQLIVVNRTSIVPDHTGDNDNDSGVQPSPSSPEVFHVNIATDGHSGTSEDSLATKLAAVRLEDDADGECLQQLPENDSKHVELPADCTGPELQNGYLETCDATPKCIHECSFSELPCVVSVTLANDNYDDDEPDLGIQLKSSEERQRNDDVETGNAKQSDAVEDSLETRLEAVTLDDAATAETNEQKLLRRGPMYGVETSSQSTKYMKCSPRAGDGAPVNSVSGFIGAQLISATQPLPTGLGFTGAQLSATQPLPTGLGFTGAQLNATQPLPTGMGFTGAQLSAAQPVPTSLGFTGAQLSATQPVPTGLGFTGAQLSAAQPVPTSLGFTGAQLSTTQPVPTGLGYLDNQSSTQNVPRPNMAVRYLPTQQRIPGPFVQPQCRFMPGRTFIPSNLPNHAIFPTSCKAQEFLPCPPFSGNPPRAGQLSMRQNFPYPTQTATLHMPTEHILPELSTDDVNEELIKLKGFDDQSAVQLQRITQHKGNDIIRGFPIMETVPVIPSVPCQQRLPSPEEIVGQTQLGQTPPYFFDTSAVIRHYPDNAPAHTPDMMLPNQTHQHHISNFMPPVVANQQFDSPPPPLEQVPVDSPASSWTQSASSPISSATSDTSQFVGSVQSGDASSFGDPDVTQQRRSLSGSYGGSPGMMTDDGRGSIAPSPSDTAMSPSPSDPPNQSVVNESDLYEFICDMNKEIVQQKSDSVASFLSGKTQVNQYLNYFFEALSYLVSRRR